LTLVAVAEAKPPQLLPSPQVQKMFAHDRDARLVILASPT
jgi:hypothetical protein